MRTQSESISKIKINLIDSKIMGNSSSNKSPYRAITKTPTFGLIVTHICLLSTIAK